MELTVNGKKEHLEPIFSVIDMSKTYLITFKDRKPQRHIDKKDKVKFELYL